MKLSNQQARHVILALQGLCDSPNRRLGTAGLYDLIHRLGYVQVDSIQWVERAHHMILFARNQTYQPSHLKNLIEREKLLFEHWTHDASIVPSAFYPIWRYRFSRTKDNLAQKFGAWQGDGYMAHLDTLMERVRSENGLRSRDLERTDNRPRDMWQWHDGKAALEFLWRTGELCIKGRDSFQKIYGLPEDSIPEDNLARRVSSDEFTDWVCHQSLRRLGFGSAGDLARYFDLLRPAEVKAWLEDNPNAATEIEVEGHKRQDTKTQFARPDLAEVCDALPKLLPRMRALSPFDPVIRNRDRLEWLFGFEYRIEIYVPESKRRWGYYVFPLLEKDKVIGRIDMRASRKTNSLDIRNIWLEPKTRWSAARQGRLEAELSRQAKFTGMAKIVWENDERPHFWISD